MVVSATALCRDHPYAGETLIRPREQRSASLRVKRYLVSASFVYYKHASTNKIASPLPLSNKLGMYGASRLCVPEAAKGPVECLSKRPVVPQNYPDL